MVTPPVIGTHFLPSDLWGSATGKLTQEQILTALQVAEADTTKTQAMGYTFAIRTAEIKDKKAASKIDFIKINPAPIHNRLLLLVPLLQQGSLPLLLYRPELHSLLSYSLLYVLRVDPVTYEATIEVAANVKSGYVCLKVLKIHIKFYTHSQLNLL